MQNIGVSYTNTGSTLSIDDNEAGLHEISLKFIREVKRVRGGDKASEVIRELADSLGNQWSARIIFDLLGRDFEDDRIRLTVPVYGRSLQKISLIKGLRWLSGQGLKEAKDAIEALIQAVEYWESQHMSKGNHNFDYSSAPYIDLKIATQDRKAAVSEFTSAGGLII
ncbi:hypothetical protein D3C87_917790 [compost metagenome]